MELAHLTDMLSCGSTSQIVSMRPQGMCNFKKVWAGWGAARTHPSLSGFINVYPTPPSVPGTLNSQEYENLWRSQPALETNAAYVLTLTRERGLHECRYLCNEYVNGGMAYLIGLASGGLLGFGGGVVVVCFPALTLSCIFGLGVSTMGRQSVTAALRRPLSRTCTHARTCTRIEVFVLRDLRRHSPDSPLPHLRHPALHHTHHLQLITRVVQGIETGIELAREEQLEAEKEKSAGAAHGG